MYKFLLSKHYEIIPIFHIELNTWVAGIARECVIEDLNIINILVCM